MFVDIVFLESSLKLAYRKFNLVQRHYLSCLFGYTSKIMYEDFYINMHTRENKI